MSLYVNSVTCSIWAALANVSAGAHVSTNNLAGQSGYWPLTFECTTPGTTGASMPAWNVTPGGSTNDGSAVWITRQPTTAANATSSLFLGHVSSSAGGTVYLHNAHTESSASPSLTAVGTITAPVKILCANFSAGDPPTALSSGASLTFTSSLAFAGSYVMDGVNITMSGAATLDVTGSSPCDVIIRNGTINLGTNAGAALRCAGLDTRSVELYNVPVVFGNASQKISLFPGKFKWLNTANATSGVVPTTLISFFNNGLTVVDAAIDGVDLSFCSGNIIDSGDNQSTGKVSFKNSPLHASATKITGSSPGYTGCAIEFIGCDKTYSVYGRNYQGAVQHETTLIRTSGANDGTTGVSWKMVSTANSSYYRSLKTIDMATGFITSTGNAKTATVEFLHDSLTPLTTADIFLEVEYLSSATTPIVSRATNKATDVLNSGANHSTSTVTWTTTGMTNPNKQKMVVSFTPQSQGPARVRVGLIKTSYTVYIDPDVVLA